VREQCAGGVPRLRRGAQPSGNADESASCTRFHKNGYEANIRYQISPVLNAISLVECNMGAILPQSTRDYAQTRGI